VFLLPGWWFVRQQRNLLPVTGACTGDGGVDAWPRIRRWRPIYPNDFFSCGFKKLEASFEFLAGFCSWSKRTFSDSGGSARFAEARIDKGPGDLFFKFKFF